jgi:hypothetical protein
MFAGKRGISIAILTFALAAGMAWGESTTAPSPDDAPAPAAMAPTYIAIGKELLLRVSIVRRTLDDLVLDAQVRKHATQILDDAEKSLRQLVQAVELGNMPTYGSIMAVPQNMRAAHENLLTVIGPDQAQLLDEKLRSLRGEARGEIAKIRQELDDKNLPGKSKHVCDAALADADAAIEKLPDTDVEGDQYAADRQAMDHLVAKTRDDLAKVLASIEQSKLDPTTQPSPRS